MQIIEHPAEKALDRATVLVDAAHRLRRGFRRRIEPDIGDPQAGGAGSAAMTLSGSLIWRTRSPAHLDPPDAGAGPADRQRVGAAPANSEGRLSDVSPAAVFPGGYRFPGLYGR
jgi:hypothetical protein